MRRLSSEIAESCIFLAPRGCRDDAPPARQETTDTEIVDEREEGAVVGGGFGLQA